MAYIYPTTYPSAFGRAVRLYWEERNVSITNNTSDIYWELQGYNRVNDSTGYYLSGPFTVTINGTVVANNIYPSPYRVELRNIDTARDAYVTPNNGLVASGTLTGVAHASDGSATVTMAFSCDYISAAEYTCSASEDVELTKIGRASIITMPAEFSFGEAALVVTIDYQDPTFTHNLAFSCGGWSNSYNVSAGKGTWSFSIARQNSVAQTYLGSVTSATMTVVCTTYDSGGNQVGSTTTASSLGTIASGYVPTIDSITYNLPISPGGGTPVPPIQNWDYVEVTATATGVYGASITNIAIKGHQLDCSAAVAGTPNGTVTETATSGVVYTSKRITYTVTVTDSRGRKATDTLTLPATRTWAPPSVSISAHRCDSDGTPNDMGAYYQASIVCTVRQVSGLSLSYTVRLIQSGTTKQTWTAQTATSQTLTSSVFSASTTNTYKLEATLIQTIPGVTVTDAMRLSTGIVTIDLRDGGLGVAFGGTASKDNTVQIRNGWGLEIESGGLQVKNRDIYAAIYAETGDTISFTDCVINGGMFNSARSARFLVPLPKRILTGVTVDVCNLRIVYNGQTVGTSQDWVDKTGVTIVANIINRKALDLRINVTSAFTNGVNYSALAAWVTDLTLTVT